MEVMYNHRDLQNQRYIIPGQVHLFDFLPLSNSFTIYGHWNVTQLRVGHSVYRGVRETGNDRGND